MVLQRGLLAAPPCRERRHGQRLARSFSHSRGRKPSSAPDSSRLEPRELAISTFPLRTASTRPGTPMPNPRAVRAGRRSRRRGVAGSHVRGAAPTVLQVDAAVAHHQIRALDQRETQVACEIGVLEIGFVVGARRQQHDQRRAIAQAVRAGPACPAAWRKKLARCSTRRSRNCSAKTREMTSRFSSE
jgi:hypothetical protein